MMSYYGYQGEVLDLCAWIQSFGDLVTDVLDITDTEKVILKSTKESTSLIKKGHIVARDKEGNYFIHDYVFEIDGNHN